MAVHDVKKYKIECDFCGFLETVERTEKVRKGFVYLAPPLPKGWKRTTWKTPSRSRMGPFRKEVDHCPKCVDKSPEISEDAYQVVVYEGKDED